MFQATTTKQSHLFSKIRKHTNIKLNTRARNQHCLLPLQRTWHVYSTQKLIWYLNIKFVNAWHLGGTVLMQSNLSSAVKCGSCKNKVCQLTQGCMPTPCAVNYTGKNSASQLQHILQLQNIAKKINEFIIKTKTKNKILFHKSF